MLASASLQEKMFELANNLFPICRSITGDGVRKTLALLQKEIDLSLHEVPSGTPVFDWTVPDEWNIHEAYLEDPQGNRIIDFVHSNLHVLNYSTPVDISLSLEDLQEHLYSLPEQPDAIPYVSSYYQKRWGFCLQDNLRKTLQPGLYHAVIGSELKQGSLTYADLVLPGESRKEVFFTTYICHPSMANNEVSGPVVNTFLARWIAAMPRRRYTYRFVFAPETIGALVYLSGHLALLKKRMIAGFNVTCVGDERCYSYVQSPNGDTYADKVLKTVLQGMLGPVKTFSYLQRASDERQYCSPGIELPLVTFCRSKFRDYPEYHTSLDNMSFITAAGLEGSLKALQQCVLAIESNSVHRATTLGEPQLGKRGLYPTLSCTGATDSIDDMLNVWSYANGKNDLLDISARTGVSVTAVAGIVDRLREQGLLVRCRNEQDWERDKKADRSGVRPTARRPFHTFACLRGRFVRSPV